MLNDMGNVIDRLRSRLSFYIVAALVVFFDQISKLLVRIYIPLGSSVPEEGFFRFTYVTNSGGVWSLFQGHLNVLIVLSFVSMAAVLFCVFYFAYRWRTISIALGLILGGIIGNQIDRLWLRQVTDFIDWGTWPVFNIADSAGVIGVAVIVVFLVFFYKEKEGGTS
ncbi:signal peptidase II [Chloroflexota bacterium]